MADTELDDLKAVNPEPAFAWPSPPYFELLGNETASASEQCEIDLLNSPQLSCRMVRLQPNEGLVEIQTPHAPEIQSIGFAEFQRLTLTRPVIIRKHKVLSEAQAGVLSPNTNCQSFAISYHDGGTFNGITTGFVQESNGLFVYLHDTENTILRCFIPQAAIHDFRIGSQLGAILVEQKIATSEQIDAALEKQRTARSQRLGDLLTEKQVVTPEQLFSAIRHQKVSLVLKLGEALLKMDLLSENELNDALALQKLKREKPLGEILIEMGAVDRETISKVMMHKLGIPFVNLSEFKVPRDAISLVPESMARKYNFLPIYRTDKELVVAVSDPTCMPFLNELRFLTGLPITPAIADVDSLKESIRAGYGKSIHSMAAMDMRDDLLLQFQDLAAPEFNYLAAPEFNHFAAPEFNHLAVPEFNHLAVPESNYLAVPESNYLAVPESNSADLRALLEAESADAEVVEDSVSESDNTLVKFVNKMILDAHAQQASDIHVETYSGSTNIRIRFRKDGIMVDYMELPPKFRNAMISRIKIMSQLDISNRRQPQDGRIDFKRFGPARIVLRVATTPTANGLEDAVMRVLVAVKPVPIDRLGMEPKELAELKQLLLKPHGLILVCGPTGSGKTTTLHSALSYINTPERKILTAEDPIEINQHGLRQVQVNPKIGFTFAKALRSFLRLDPDVIMVGEMRDEETAKIGLEASLTGHLVLSTLHTNSAVESLVRLLDMGADPFQFADALLAVLAQRLVRRLCLKCKKPYAPAADELRTLAMEYCHGTPLDADAEIERWSTRFGAGKPQLVLYKANGCPDCGGLGYKGRLGVYELFVAQPAVKRQIQSKAPASDILLAALAEGMHTLKQNGIEKVLRGETDMLQVRAVCA